MSYNKSQFVAETINSVKKQTYNNWEAIIIDDCSSDNSLDIIEKLIIKALYRLNKPSPLKQIVKEVKKDRENVKESSVHILLSKICYKSVDNYYILKDWKSKYPELEIKEKRKSIKKPNPPSYRTKQLDLSLIHI